jgi:hypothetical protein
MVNSATHFYGDVAFAHGGMGYFISNGAMRLLDKIYDPEHIAQWERRVSEGCCGDVELAAVLTEAGVNITGVPGLYGESLTWFEWDEGRWCEPALSWHHMRAHDVEAIWQFETKWVAEEKSHYVYSDLFRTLVEPHLSNRRNDWDNMSRDRIYTGPSGMHGDEDRRYKQKIRWEDLSEEEREDIWKDLDDDRKAAIEETGHHMKEIRWDELSEEEREAAWSDLEEVEKEAHKSLHNCRSACEEWNECIQYWYMTDRCHLHRTIRLGHYLESRSSTTDDDTTTVSGWMMDRVEDLKGRVESCKTVPDWMKQYAEDELHKLED